MDTTQLTAKQFQQFQAFILRVSGISVPDNKITLLSNRIRRRLRATNSADFESYLQYLKSAAGAEELDPFLSVVTTNETSFFRTEKHFEWLRTAFLESLTTEAREGKRQKRVRIWSAACSTGEEPYTIALCLAENLHKLTGWKLEILGTDISEHAIAKARAGVFGNDIMDDVPEKMRSRFFIQQGESNSWQVRPILKRTDLF